MIRLGYSSVFMAALTGLFVSRLAVPAEAQRVFNQIAISGQIAPGIGGGVRFRGVGKPTINDSGDVAFIASLPTGPTVGSSNDLAIFGPTAGAGSPLGVIVREGDPAPGAIDGALYNNFEPLSLALNDSGDVAFRSIMRPALGGPVPFQGGDAWFGPSSGAGSPLGLIARSGQPAPGTTDGAEFRNLFGTPSLNASGDLAFGAFLQTGSGAVVTSDNNRAVFGPTAGAGSPLGVVARDGDVAPGTLDAAEFSGLGLFEVSVNDSGDVAFNSGLRTGTGPTVTADNDRALFGPTSGTGSLLGVIAREGEAAPGTLDGAAFDNFGSASLNEAGETAFIGFLKTGTGPEVTSDNNTSLFGPRSGTGSPLGVIAREGESAPGTTDAAEFFSFGNPTLNDRGDIVFGAIFRTGAGQAATFLNDFAIFASVGGELELIVREGDSFDVINPATSQAETRTIQTVTFDLSDTGVLALQLSFTDNTTGIFTTQLMAIPEPASLLLFGVASVAFAAHRRRNR